MKNTEKAFKIRPVNRMFITGMSVMLLVFAGIACYYSVSFQVHSLMTTWNDALGNLYDAYYDKVYSFSDVYEPVFVQNPDQSVMRAYFSRSGSQTPTAVQHSELASVLSVMVAQDNDIEWVALINPHAERNYYLLRGHNQISILPSDFPFYPEQGAEKTRRLGARQWPFSDISSRMTFCIQGGAIPAGMPGNILVGYSLESMDRVLERTDVDDSVTYLIYSDSEIIYDSSAAHYGKDFREEWRDSDGLFWQDKEGGFWLAKEQRNNGRGFSCVYISPVFSVIAHTMKEVPMLMGLLLGFAAVSLTLYGISSRSIFNRVTKINSGLACIGQNRLDYRLEVGARGDEFDEISESINVMTELLQNTMDKEYELRLKHMQLQLTQIQARFNPHFLYNTLEIIRGRLFESGDLESADYIEKLARIFRNLTDAKAIVSLRDEISFCSLYVALLRLRYKDDVNVYYDIAPELHDCGIIANLIQPAIENYFVHAITAENDNNELEISCQPLGDSDIQIVVADNGTGNTQSRIDEINAHLISPPLDAKSYGLMSIAKRIRLFYGDHYGVRIEKNNSAGISVVMTIPRMSLAEHESKLLPAKQRREEP